MKKNELKKLQKLLDFSAYCAGEGQAREGEVEENRGGLR